MTYKRMIQGLLKSLTKEQLESDVIVYVKDIDEFISIKSIKLADKNVDVLDRGHPYLVI